MAKAVKAVKVKAKVKAGKNEFNDDLFSTEVIIMPRFDRTGPFGAGPMTGGARGLCNPAVTGYRSSFFGGAGFGRDMGLGRGFRGGTGRGVRGGFGQGFGWYPPAYVGPYPDTVDTAGELDMLKAQADSVKNTLDAIHKRIAELEKTL